MSDTASMAATDKAARFEVAFVPYNTGRRAHKFPCDAAGNVDLDAFTEIQRDAYFTAKTLVGFHYRRQVKLMIDPAQPRPSIQAAGKGPASRNLRNHLVRIVVFMLGALGVHAVPADPAVINHRGAILATGHWTGHVSQVDFRCSVFSFATPLSTFPWTIDPPKMATA